MIEEYSIVIEGHWEPKIRRALCIAFQELLIRISRAFPTRWLIWILQQHSIKLSFSHINVY